MSEMLPELPSSLSDIFIEYDERLRYVLNYDNLRAYLSGEEKAQPFCVLTDDRLYACSGDLKGETEIVVSDIDNVEDVKSVKRKKRRHFYFEPFLAFLSIALAVAAMLVGIGIINILIGGPYFAAYSGTMFLFLALILFGFGGYMLIRWINILKYSVLPVMDISYSNGKKQSIPICEGAGTETAAKLCASLRAAKLAKKSDIPDLFIF